MGGFDFAVKIHFESKCCGVKHRAAVLAVAQMPLDVTSDFRCQAAFQVFAN